MADSNSNQTPSAQAEGVRFLVRALRHRNYRLFFGGQSVSLIGTWMTRIATSWLVYRLTGSAMLLGLVGFAGQLPTFLLAPFAGVWVDRWNRHRVLVVTQVLAMLQSFALAVLALTGRITAWDILWLNAFQGAINAFDMPARQAFVLEMVTDRGDLSNAIALNSSMVNMARLIGPSIAGLIIAVVGEGYCFLIDGFSYLAVIASLLFMRLATVAPTRRGKNTLADLKEGWQYVTGFAPVRDVMLLLCVASLMGMPYMVLMPIFAGQILHGGPHTLGFLMGATGVGALTGAVILAARRSVLGLGRVIWLASTGFGAGLIAFSASRWLWLSYALMFVVGLGMMQQMASSNTILQTITPDDKRGRVMSYYTVAIVGMMPFGSLLSGWLAARLGAPIALAIGGAACVIGAGIFALRLGRIRALVHPIYVQLGIIPEIAEGINSAAVLTSVSEE
ncbi:MAG TPA: MFS transporter [Candidatus Angelobacter sp.]|nr:MFS transporter [Candidatus Angelobacter sp.]